MDEERGFMIVLDKLLETSNECEKMRGERDIARSELSKVMDTLRQRDRDIHNMRETVDFTSSDSFQNTLKRARELLITLPERDMELERLLKEAIEKTDFIPF